METNSYLLLYSIFTVAILYSLVGHGGASGYIAVMALLGFAPAHIRPTALCLNIVVSLVAAVVFSEARHFSWTLFWPFAALSIPFSYLGGRLSLASSLYRPLLGVTLLYSVFVLLRRRGPKDEADDLTVKRPALPLALLCGGGIGFLSGLTGVGGGIFLSPLLLVCHWGRVREVAGISALFILCNSLAGLAGYHGVFRYLPGMIPHIAGAALFGGAIGSSLGCKWLPSPALVRILSLILIIAGVKLLLG